MLAKCTNISCSAAFRHLGEGRLFRLETDSPAGSSNAKATEYFWLCEPCSGRMTLCLAENGRIMAAELREGLRNGPKVAVISENRENGRFCHSVGFFRRSHPKGN
jgi:hypothetical protein